MGMVLSFEEGRNKLRFNKSPAERELAREIKRGNPVVFADYEADAFIFPQYDTSRVIEYEDEIPPLDSC